MRKLTKEEHMVSPVNENRLLLTRLAGKNVAWRVASCGDVSDLVLLQNCKSVPEFEVPDIFLHTDDRSEDVDLSYWDGTTISHSLPLDSRKVARTASIARNVALT